MVISSPRSGKNAYKPAPLDWSDPRQWSRQIAEVANGLLDGKINATGAVTLTANQATTVITDQRIGPNSVILFMPTTANAAAEVGAGGFYVSSRGEKTATITHANSAQADRDFSYVALG